MAQASLGATAATSLTLMDWASRLDPDGRVAKVAELLAQTNDMLLDIPWVEGNLPVGHRTTIRSDLPTPTWRKLNYGVAPTKSKTTQVTEATGMLEAYSEVDKELADLNGNTGEFRLSEDRPHLEGMNQTFNETLIYGDTTATPEKFLGLAPRYPSIGNPSGKVGTSYGNQVIDAGGTGSDLSSIWVVAWGENTVHGIFPKGSKAGLSHKDMGEVTLFDEDAGRYQGYRSHYMWKAGLVVRDWRYIVRIANVETGSSGGSFNAVNLIKALNTLPNMTMGKPVIYVNRLTKSEIDIAVFNKSNAAFSLREVNGKPQTEFWGVPIRQVDQLLTTETALT